MGTLSPLHTETSAFEASCVIRISTNVWPISVGCSCCCLFFALAQWTVRLRTVVRKTDRVEATDGFVRRIIFSLGLCEVLSHSPVPFFCSGELRQWEFNVVATSITRIPIGIVLTAVSALVDVWIWRDGKVAVFEWWIGCLQGLLTRFEGIRMCGSQIASRFYFTSDSLAEKSEKTS